MSLMKKITALGIAMLFSFNSISWSTPAQILQAEDGQFQAVVDPFAQKNQPQAAPLPEDPFLNESPFSPPEVAAAPAVNQIDVYAGQDLQAAIDNAQAGDVVFLHNGIYHGHFVLKDGVDLKGESRGGVVLDGDEVAGQHVIRAMRNNRIENLTITGSAAYAGAPSSAVRIEGDYVEIINNDIVDNRGYGLYAWNSAGHILVEGNLIKNCNVGIQLPKDSNVIRFNTLVGNNIAINVLNGEKPRIEYNIITGSTFSAIYEFSWSDYSAGRSSRGNAIVENNTFYNNAWHATAYGSSIPPAVENLSAGNINGNPQFTNAAAGNYFVADDSPGSGRGAFLRVKREYDLSGGLAQVKYFDDQGVLQTSFDVKMLSQPGVISNSEPHMNARGQAVWQGCTSWGSGCDIYFFNGNSVINLTHDSRPDIRPQINDLGHIVFESGIDGDIENHGIYYYDGISIRKVSTGPYYSIFPRINNNDHITWVTKTVAFGYTQVMYYNQSTIQQITSGNQSSGNNGWLQINDDNHIVYNQNDSVFLWNGTTTIRLSAIGADLDSPIKFAAHDQAVWVDRGSNPGVYYYNGTETIRLTTGVNDFSPSINDSGKVVWMGQVNQINQVFYYDGVNITQLTNGANAVYSPRINNRGSITWSAGVGPSLPSRSNYEVFFYDSNETHQLTRDDKFDHGVEQINENGDLLWVNEDAALGWRVWIAKRYDYQPLHQQIVGQPQMVQNLQVAPLPAPAIDKKLGVVDAQVVDEVIRRDKIKKKKQKSRHAKMEIVGRAKRRG